ncbi:MAG: prephenate dehydratase [Gammaproteobacteria bacterium]|jgi:chorismate mutase/prephenate dehydratase|nr:prephenate dehydratase [Gammaproteobacteria bacterium]|tara:strand:+ start:655 stop:1761 length:1107 start_codon:yes stop_codon:yes gene_type:complete
MADKPNGQEQLTRLRQRIDQLDEEILKRLNERAECAVQVADVKKLESEDVDPVYYRPEREAQVLRRMTELSEGPLSSEKITRVYRQIMSACLALEKPLEVAYLGPEGTFTQLATLKQFGDSVIGLPMITVDDVFREVASENCNYGVVPVENSSEGVITHTLDNFLNSSLQICGEVELRVHHHLMIARETDETKIERIYSHQQTLGQCRSWLDSHYPNTPNITTTSNAEAARKVMEEKGAAAIAGEIAAEIYGLRILSKKIEDQSDNTTRFIVVGRDDVGVSGKDKTSIMVSTHNQPGALFKLLEPFDRHDVSLTSIETRPSKTGMWSYVFFIDFEGHREDEVVKTVLGEIDKDALEVKMLGSYPRTLS